MIYNSDIISDTGISSPALPVAPSNNDKKESKKDKKSKKKGKLTKEDIGIPTDFRLVAHIEFWFNLKCCKIAEIVQEQKIYLSDDKAPFIRHTQYMYHGHRWPGITRSQAINRHVLT